MQWQASIELSIAYCNRIAPATAMVAARAARARANLARTQVLALSLVHSAVNNSLRGTDTALAIHRALGARGGAVRAAGREATRAENAIADAWQQLNAMKAVARAGVVHKKPQIRAEQNRAELHK